MDFCLITELNKLSSVLASLPSTHVPLFQGLFLPNTGLSSIACDTSRIILLGTLKDPITLGLIRWAQLHPSPSEQQVSLPAEFASSNDLGQ